MAEFIITELRATGSGRFEDTPNRFVWDGRTQTAPERPWTFAIEQTTAREDYPGGDEPTEQRLGPKLNEFSLKGFWEDRLAGQGFARRTREAMESLIARGPLVRIDCVGTAPRTGATTQSDGEAITVTGLIIRAEFQYHYAGRIDYELTFSPHYRVRGEVRKFAEAPKLANPTVHQQITLKQLAAMEAANAEAPSSFLKEELLDQVLADTNAVSQRLAEIDATIKERLLKPVERSVDTLGRLANSFALLKSSASSLITRLGSVRSDANLMIDKATAVLDFECWLRSLSWQARLMVLASDKASQELSVRVEPTALAVYAPQKGESLYAISNRFYGTPHRWRDIAQRNNLGAQFTLTGTEVLVIPEAGV